MLNKKVAKDIQNLSRKSYRDETGLFLVEGPKAVAELVQAAPGHLLSVYATADWQAPVTHPSIEIISVQDLQRISALKTANQVLVVAKQFKAAPPTAKTVTLYLDTIQDPGNLGTIIRIADWFGVNDVVCSLGCADVYNPKTVQSTMGSIARVNVFRDENDKWLLSQKVPVYAASLTGKPLPDFDKLKEGILIIGNESKGVRSEFLSLARESILIERRGGAESLNAAVAAGILLSHLV